MVGEDVLSAAFNNIPCGLGIYLCKDGKIHPMFHNPVFYDIMGYSPEHIRELELKTEFLGVHPEDLEPLKAEVERALRNGSTLRWTYRVFNDREGKYHWIKLEASVRTRQDGKVLYGVYSDVSDQIGLEQELANANDKMQDIINAIPGGVAIYRVSDCFEPLYFSDGVPELTGYTVEEYRELIMHEAAKLTCPEDTAMVAGRLRKVIGTQTADDFEFREIHRDGHIVWVRVMARRIGEDNGAPLLHCVFHNITDLKEAQMEKDYLINSIPGGIASYRIIGRRFIPAFYTDGVIALSGYTREEHEKLVAEDALDIIYEGDRERVATAAHAAVISGEVLDVFYRMRHKNGNLVWIHLNGRRMGPLSESSKFYAVFTGMSEESHIYRNIANGTADGIYVIDKKNFDLLYANESKALFLNGSNSLGQKCYKALHGKDAPCEFCTLKKYKSDGTEHEINITGSDRFFNSRSVEADWNGLPSYIQYIRDTTEEVLVRREKERLEQYFQTVVKNLPGGVAVVRCEKDGRMIPEYMSDGFAAMTGMSLEEAWQIYNRNAMEGVHPEDRDGVNEQMKAYVESGNSHCEIVYRLKKGSGGYAWVKNTLSMIQNEGGESRVYAVYQDMTRELEEQRRIRRQYKELILRHYSTPDPNALIMGHCNITQNQILDIIDYTDSDLLKTFGSVREEFFQGISGLVVDERERRAFRRTFLNAPTLAAYKRKDTELIQKCFVKLPKETYGRYVQFKVNLVETPDSGDITGVLTVTDITDQTISDQILHQLSVTGYEFIIDLDLHKDTYTILAGNKNLSDMPETGSHSMWVKYMLENRVVPKDSKRYAEALNPEEIRRRLRDKASYTFSYATKDEDGDIRTKNVTISAIDLRLGRACVVRTDITESLREQQGLLNMIAYTFELAGLIDVGSGQLTMYTRETVLKNLSPYRSGDYNGSIEKFAGFYGTGESIAFVKEQFHMDTLLRRLEEKPGGYDFVVPYHTEDGLLYKQINVLWGDVNHRTICLVRADVTEMLAAERETKKTLENALALAKEANRAKSDFLSAMSHDIRTPMNAIIGMTALAGAHLDERERIKDCLGKISVSSRHLLSLINDILDMSKIEQSKISLNCARISLPDLTEQLSAIIQPQAEEAGLRLNIRTEGVSHINFYGDRLRINQILINILSNAIKFTPAGGAVEFLIEELPLERRESGIHYRFTVSDTGVGIRQEFLDHIFEPFTRNQNAYRVEGTGLGLSITKGLVDLMDGKISVESQIGKGSTFVIELEFAAADGEDSLDGKSKPEFSESEKKELFNGRCFLVAEDNSINAEILCELLGMQGAKTVVAADGAQAVQTFRTARPGVFDAVLMDVQMPEMDGYEATRAIRRLPRADAEEIPIIAMTANAFAEDVQAALEAGMNAHVAKPIDLEVLWETLGKALYRPRP